MDKMHKKSRNRGKEPEKRKAHVRKRKCIVMVFKVVIKGDTGTASPKCPEKERGNLLMKQ